MQLSVSLFKALVNCLLDTPSFQSISVATIPARIGKSCFVKDFPSSCLIAMVVRSKSRTDLAFLPAYSRYILLIVGLTSKTQ